MTNPKATNNGVDGNAFAPPMPYKELSMAYTPTNFRITACETAFTFLGAVDVKRKTCFTVSEIGYLSDKLN